MFLPIISPLFHYKKSIIIYYTFLFRLFPGLLLRSKTTSVSLRRLGLLTVFKRIDRREASYNPDVIPRNIRKPFTRRDIQVQENMILSIALTRARNGRRAKLQDDAWLDLWEETPFETSAARGFLPYYNSSLSLMLPQAGKYCLYVPYSMCHALLVRRN
jgi:hypothetical protein